MYAANTQFWDVSGGGGGGHDYPFDTFEIFLRRMVSCIYLHISCHKLCKVSQYYGKYNFDCITPLKYVVGSKYLGLASVTKQDDNDILRQMRTVYAKSNTLLRSFSHCSTDVKVTLFQSYCTALYCPFLWSDYKKSTFRKIRVAFNNAYRKIFGLPKRSSASAMYAQHNICKFETTIRKSI